MKTFIISMPVFSMRTALRALDEARRVHSAVNEEAASLPPLNAVEDGMKAVKKREEDLAALEARKNEATQKALTVIDQAYNAAVAEIDRQTMPTGADISGENEGDFKLLEYGLATTPAALERIVTAHDTPAFRAMAKQYASKRNWIGFEFLDSEKTLREFTDDFFGECRKAAGSPVSGYYGMLLQDDTELERQATAAGLVAEYRKGA